MSDFSAFTESNSFAPALEITDLVQIRERYELYINGAWVEPVSGEYIDTFNPTTGEKLAEIAVANEIDVDLAVGAARDAYEGEWGRMPGAQRGKLLFRLARLIQECSRELAVLETIDGGKPIRESRDIDLPLVAAHFFYNAGWADKLEYAFPGRGVRSVGVCGQVIPWNFPLLMAAWKLAPALACGNTVVIKPAETTSLSMLRLIELIEEAGFPPGVVNVVTGAGEVGESVVTHNDVDKVAFTGSTAVGKRIQRLLAGTHKRYSLELGGKAAQIVFDDAAIDQAVEGVVNGIFMNQGHVCCAGSRLLVQEGVADEVISKLKARMATLVVGNPLDKNTDIGAVNSPTQCERIDAMVRVGEQEGCTLWDAGQALPSEGNWCRPTLLLDCAQSHRVVQEEIFGPILTVQTFRTPEEAIEKANNTPYGLSGGVWTEKGAKSFSVTSQIKAGVLWANTFNRFDPCSPFGGYKESGVGREGGVHGLAPYVEVVF